MGSCSVKQNAQFACREVRQLYKPACIVILSVMPWTCRCAWCKWNATVRITRGVLIPRIIIPFTGVRLAEVTFGISTWKQNALQQSSLGTLHVTSIRRKYNINFRRVTFLRICKCNSM